MSGDQTPASILAEMELRQKSLEKEVSVLKDTVWRLTGRVFVLETFLSEKFDELVVDFGLRLSLSSGGNAAFLAQAMQAEASVVSPRDRRRNSHPTEPSTSSAIHTHTTNGRRSSRERFQDLPGESRHQSEEDYSGETMDLNSNPEEFVVFPHVPEFMMGEDEQNNGSHHLSSEGEEEEEDEEEEENTAQNALISPSILHTMGRRNPRYKCVPCAKFFSSEWHLKAHLIKHQGPSSSCSSVDGSQQVISIAPLNNNNSGDSLITPENIHLVKPFACVYCGKRFKKRQELTVHIRIHTGEKPYKCPVCDRGFSQSSSMKTHLRIHTGEKPFKCSFCKSCFTVMHNYKKHLQTAHNIDEEYVWTKDNHQPKIE